LGPSSGCSISLVSSVNGKRYGIGTLSLPTLAELRSRVKLPPGRRTTVECLASDVAALHAAPEFEGALFQVASQFNLLEMTGPTIRPEDGVARCANDPTQGPACAIAAGAATIYRNYSVPVGAETGQTHDRQIDTLAALGAALSSQPAQPVGALWNMSNGYALRTDAGLAAITDLLANATDEQRDSLRGQLTIGLHRNVEVTAVNADVRHQVAQAFCSTLPVAYVPDDPAHRVGIVRAPGAGGRLRGDAAGRGRTGRRRRLPHGAANPRRGRSIRQRARVDRRRHLACPVHRRTRRTGHQGGRLNRQPLVAEDRQTLESPARQPIHGGKW
jgi:hypothetical protein